MGFRLPGKQVKISQVETKATVFTASLCNHWRQPVAIGNFVVYASAYFDRPKEKPIWKPEEKPDLFVGLDSLWIDRVMGDIVSLGVEGFAPLVPSIIVDWYDKQNCPQVEQVVGVALKYIQAGKRVEVACMGGHGRTGSMLAMLVGKIEGLDAFDAIKAVRERYCKEAVESQLQVEQIYTVLGADLGRVEQEWEFPKNFVVGGKKGYGDYYECPEEFGDWYYDPDTKAWAPISGDKRATAEREFDKLWEESCGKCEVEECGTCEKWRQFCEGTLGKS